MPGEATSIFLKEEKVGPVELATIAFGQRFEITPIQLATAVSTIANGGIKVTPRIVKKIVNSDTGEVKDIEVKTGERVISEEHAAEVLSMMESVVALGTGKRGQVKGYRVGGKTGTSEDGVNTNKYVASFLGVAPISDPTVVALVTLYDPKGEAGHQGGVVAAPVGGQVLSEILPYLELTKDNEKEEDIKKQVEVPNIEGLTIKEATKLLKSLNLDLQIENEVQDLDKENTIVKAQGLLFLKSYDENGNLIIYIAQPTELNDYAYDSVLTALKILLTNNTTDSEKLSYYFKQNYSDFTIGNKDFDGVSVDLNIESLPVSTPDTILIASDAKYAKFTISENIVKEKIADITLPSVSQNDGVKANSSKLFLIILIPLLILLIIGGIIYKIKKS